MLAMARFVDDGHPDRLVMVDRLDRERSKRDLEPVFECVCTLTGIRFYAAARELKPTDSGFGPVMRWGYNR